jgi:amino acid adenylation domain-containing protein/thioester reductase-like protein
MSIDHKAGPATATERRELAERLLAARLRRAPDDRTEAIPRVTEGEARLSFAQQRMWFLHTMEPDGRAYQITSAARLHGPVDPDRLRAAVVRLTERHDLLRSAFPAGPDGLPRRHVRATVAAPLTVLDLTGRPAGERAAAADDAVAEHLARPFDVATAPLFRLLLVRLTPGEHRLALAVHHLVADGWSLGVLHRELAELYGSGPGTRLPEPATSFDAFAAREAALSDDPGDPGRAYWRTTLTGLPQVELPMAGERPATAGSRGRRLERHLDEDRTRALEELGRRHGASLYVVLVAGLAGLLHRYSGQTDIALGSPVANRTDPGLAHTVGLFVNSVVLRTDLTGDPDAGTLLGRVREAALGALEHQGTPFEQVVADLLPERSLSHNPLFQVMIALQNADSGELALGTVPGEAVGADLDVARFHLEFTLFRHADGLRLRINYRHPMFDDDVAGELADAYTSMLAELAARPDVPLSRLDVFEAAALPGAALQAPEPSGSPATLTGLFTAVADRTPGSVAIADAAGELTFAALRERAGAVAAELARRGIGRGDVVAVCTRRTVDLVTATLGTLLAGAAFVPVNPEDPADRRDFLLADSGARAVLTDTGDTGPRSVEPPYIEVAAAVTAGGTAPSVPASPDDLAYVLYTSGTTGRPKGVAVEHRNIANTLLGCGHYFGFRPDDVGLVLAPSTFDVFYYELFSAMLAGGRSVLVTKEETFDPERVAALFSRATTFQAVPGLMEHLLSTLREAGAGPSPSVRTVVTGGDVVPGALIATLHETFPRARVAVTYGPTETAIFATGHTFPRGEEPAGHPIGVPLPGVRIRVADEHGRPLPAGVAGELWIGGAGVARGYLNRPEENAARFADIGGTRFYRSGDRARLRYGRLEFLGRADTQVKVRGFRIEVGEVESVLAGVPGVRRGVVLPVGDGPSDRRLVAYVVPDGEADRTNAAGTVTEWRELFDETHRAAAPGARDFTGWNSSYDGAPLPRHEMDEWVDATVAAVRARLAGMAAPQILEIGCGTGLLLTALAPHAGRYVGTDFSAPALAGLSDRIRADGLDNVELHLADADALPDTGPADLVLINSVTQYLPDADYLERVLDQALARTRPGGAVFVGDVRSLPLLDHFCASVERHRDPAATAEQISARAAARRSREDELVLSPAFFRNFAAERTAVGTVEVEPRLQAAVNELTRYRYNVVLWRTPATPEDDLDWQPWTGLPAGGATDGAVDGAVDGADVLALTGIPHAHLSGDPAAISPVRLREHAVAAGYSCEFSWAACRPDGSFDAVLHRTGTTVRPNWPQPGGAPVPTAQTPARAGHRRDLAADVREWLGDRLAGYLMPAAVVVVDALPLTPNGKVDRAALAELAVPAAGNGRAPSGPTELAVAEAWTEVLGGATPGAEDDFFAVGGTSLLAIRLVVALRRRGLRLPPQLVFELTTVERIARRLDRDEAPATPAVATPRTEPTAIPAGPAGPEIPETGPDRWLETNRLLLTGATGMLGVHVLDTVLRDYPDLEVTCLVRAGDDDAARRRLAEQYGWYFPGRDSRRFATRVRAHAADLRRDGLGLTAAARRAVVRGCDAILHTAADVRHVAAEDDVYAANTDGTRRLLELAADMDSPRFGHISTIGVAGRMPDGREARLDEDRLDVGQTPTEAYSASKIAAERLVRGYTAGGGRTTVLRVGTVAPNHVTGRFQRNVDAHFFSRYVRAVLALGVATDWPHRRLALIPADVMASMVLTLTGQDAATGRTCHVQSPHETTHGELARMLGELGYPIRLIQPERFADTVVALGADPAHAEDVGRMLPMLEAPAGRAVRLEHARTGRWLGRLGLRYPALDREFLARFVRHGVAVGYFPAPADGRPIR